jgi:hypothetical protein
MLKPDQANKIYAISLTAHVITAINSMKAKDMQEAAISDLLAEIYHQTGIKRQDFTLCEFQNFKERIWRTMRKLEPSGLFIIQKIKTNKTYTYLIHL